MNHPVPFRCLWLVVLVLGMAWGVDAGAPERDDVVIADFEGDTYGAWMTIGSAFGTGPAQGTLPGQMHVSGFLGRGLVNSFHGGDAAAGTLTSPPFTIQRPYLNFLIGGGAHPGQTCLNLLRESAVVRTATGPNDRPGGSERLDWASWDVTELLGKTVVLQVVDRHIGGWGHINVDQIVQSDRRRGLEPARREVAIRARYLHLPVANDAPVRRLRLVVNQQTKREFDIKLAAGRPDFWVFSDLAPFRGQRLRIEAELPVGSDALTAIAQADEVPGAAAMYREPLRPQFHFTARRGWLNDPNGLVFHDGEYHLFFQHNPYGREWGNMHWGHAVSPDLVHWTELPEALVPRQYDDRCFSGSAVVDRENRSGFGTGASPPLVLAFTSTGRGECIAYSNDRGWTWTEYAENPVIRHQGRDPRLVWHAPTDRWIMAVYDETGGRRAIAFYSSPDLKAWKYESAIDGFYECPDLFELPVEGEPGRRLWVLHGADGAYLLGRFDGRRFTPESGKHRLWYGDFYAAQTFSDTPDGRRIQIGWARGVSFPGMPFDQQMTVPCELTLRPTPEGPRLFARPVAELASLRRGTRNWRDLTIEPGGDPLAGANLKLGEVRAVAFVDGSERLALSAAGIEIVYDAAKRQLICGGETAPLSAIDKTVQLRVLVDRGSVTVFGNEGRVAISRGASSTGNSHRLGVSATGRATRLQSLDVDEWTSAWP